MRYGEQIGTIEHGKFIPGNRAWRHLDTSETNTHTLSTNEQLDAYLRGEPIADVGDDEYVSVLYTDQILGLEYRK